MNTISITARKDFLQQISAAPALRALSELIWNGFDAGADRVEVLLKTNGLGGLEEVHVQDNGSGIDRNEVESRFGNLGQSWKRKHPKLNGRFLHGRNGRGRFKGFAIGERVEWKSHFEGEDSIMSYAIFGSAHSLEALSFTDPSPAPSEKTGTEVTISNIQGTFGSLLNENAPKELARIFGVYLSQYPSLQLIYQGVTIDPKMVRRSEEIHTLSGISLSEDRAAAVSVQIHEWNMPSKRGIHLCDEDGHLLQEVEVGPAVRAPGYTFTVKACSDHFRRLEEENRLAMGELDPDVSALVAPVREQIKAHFKQRIAEKKLARVAEWIEEGSHPFPDLPEEAAQRQAFEKLATHLDHAGSGMQKLDTLERMFHFHLLGTVLIHHPDKISAIVDELFPMKKGDRKVFAGLLD